jgi:hypothetical protein|tara:strand:+ start:2147 stop:3880 length:1734 start_codon:yes stop_codon:yes gene_type:complete
MATRKATKEEIESLGLADAKPEQQAASGWDAISFATGVARSIGQGVTFGFADEAEAYVRSILGPETYEEAKKATNAELSKFRGENPFLSFGLEIGAAIMTPGGILKLASKVPSLAKVAQKGMQTTTPITRGAAGGALYGAGTAETMGDVPASMALGATLGYAGARYAPAITEGAKELIKRGIPLSVGQRLGGTVGMIEEGLSKLPIGAEMIGPTRLKALQQFATATYNEALSPLGKKVTAGADPRQAAQEAQKIFSDSYKRALQGVEIDVGAGFIDDVQGVIAPYVQALDKQGREKLEQFIIDEIFERAPGDKLTGESIQAIQRRFGELAQTYMKSTDAYQSTLGRAIRAVDAEMMDLIGKYYPAKADLLKKTNEAYSMYYPVRAAATGAGVRENIFTPAKLLSAIQREERKAGAAGLNRLERGEGRLQQFAETAAETIGAKVPESAPLRTMMTMGGVGGGAAIDPVMTALALGGGKLAYTRPGQAATSFLMERVVPSAMRSPATAGLLAAEAAPTVTPMASGLLGIPSAEAGMLPGTGEARIPEPGVEYRTIRDSLGNPVTYAVTEGGTRMTRVTP